MAAVYHGSPGGAMGSTFVEHHSVITPDQWKLSTVRLRRASTEPGTPVLLVPGYGMNAFAFRFHPRGPSLMRWLLDHGFDPWAVDLRGTRSSRAPDRAARVRLADQAFLDLPAVIDSVLGLTGADHLDAVGCSLGGVLLYAYGGAMQHRLGRLVTIGSPLVWADRSWILGLFAAAGPLVGRVPVFGTATLARAALPVVARMAPDLLSIYLNPRITDTRRARELSRTVEDPHPGVSGTISRWVRRGHLVLDGHHVTEGLARFTNPLAVVHADADGICPPAAAMAAVDATGGPVEALTVTHPTAGVSHVDMFVGDHAHDAVYAPVTRFLRGGSLGSTERAAS